jgi:formylglycine-generating enzyme required for sulfatase activity
VRPANQAERGREYEVTNEQFAKFAEATGYVTVAEKDPDPKDFPGVPLDQQVNFSVR